MSRQFSIASYMGENMLDFSKLKSQKTLHKRENKLSLALERGSIGLDLAGLLKRAAIIEFHAHSGIELVEEGFFSLAEQQVKAAFKNYSALVDYLEQVKYPPEFEREFLAMNEEVLNRSAVHLNKRKAERLSVVYPCLKESLYGG